MELFEYKYSCIVDTPYSLFLYLLMSEDGDWDKTVFFVGDGIDEAYLKHLKKVVRFSSNYDDYATRAQLLKVKMRALYYRCRYICHTKLFAQDHMVFSSQLIGWNKYILVEDAPSFYLGSLDSLIKETIPIPNGIRNRFKRLIYWGPTYGLHIGRNSYCIDRLVTEEKDLLSSIINGYKTNLVNLNVLWKYASEEKKKYVFSVFNITSNILLPLQHCKTIIFTEAFSEDGLSLEEAASIFAPYVEQYKNDGVVIKPHPRDKEDWEKAFPEAKVLRTRAPMQILCIMGADFERAITVCSTAISSMKPETEIIWLRNSAHPKWIARYGKGGKCPFEGKFKLIRYE